MDNACIIVPHAGEDEMGPLSRHIISNVGKGVGVSGSKACMISPYVVDAHFDSRLAQDLSFTAAREYFDATGKVPFTQGRVV